MATFDTDHLFESLPRQSYSPSYDVPASLTAHPAPESSHVVAVCGGLNWNMISVAHRLPTRGETFNANSFVMGPGGKGANACIAIHRSSHIRPSGTTITERPRNAYEACGLHDIKVHMIGSIGSDSFGEEMKKSLAENFINVEGVRKQEGSSAIAIIMVESEHGDTRVLVHPGANHVMQPKEFLSVESFGPDRPDLVVSQLELNRETVEQLITVAKEAGIDVLLNPAPAHYLEEHIYKGLTHLIVNETEAAILTGRDPIDLEIGYHEWSVIADEFLELGVQHVVITLGAAGAYFSKQKGRGELVPAEEVPEDKVVDCSGAGDTFVGAYAVQWVKGMKTGGWDLKSAVRHCCKASAQIIQQVGCQKAIPWASDIDPAIPPSDVDAHNMAVP